MFRAAITNTFTVSLAPEPINQFRLVIMDVLKSRVWWGLWTILLAGPVCAIETLSFSIAELGASNWTMEGLVLKLDSFDRGEQTVSLKIDRLDLPEPVGGLRLVNIRCPQLILAPQNLVCKNGSANVRSGLLDRPEVSFSFIFSRNSGSLRVDKIHFAGGRSNMELSFKSETWRLNLDAKKLQLATLNERLAKSPFESAGGRVDLKGWLSGSNNEPGKFDLTATVSDGVIQTVAGDMAGEAVSLKSHTRGKKINDGAWVVSADVDFYAGGLYFEPVFLEAGNRPIRCSGSFRWQPKQRVLNVDQFSAQHPDVFRLHAQGQLLTQEPYWFNRLSIDAEIGDLKKLHSIYLAPFVEATDLESLAASGRLKVTAAILNNRIQHLDAKVSELEIDDAEERLSIQNANGRVVWSNSNQTNASRITFDGAKIYNLPLGLAELVVESDNRHAALAQNLSIPILEGTLRIKEFEIEEFLSDQPEVRFDGVLREVSLAKLSEVFGWQPLSGEVSGVIPGVSYRAGRLILDGSINISAFDGMLSIEDLVVSDLFGDLPSLNANVAINDLDLTRLTQHFSFGGMEGRLEGGVDNLYLEGWQPIAFDAWFGTPKHDDSRHRISQKALQSLTSIGGGGAADVFSRGVLRFFDAFSYQRLGIGCKLNNGVCQLRGVAPAEQGYYIVKGGGLPRIDVIGYNHRVDWNVLLRRLHRVTEADNAVVE